MDSRVSVDQPSVRATVGSQAVQAKRSDLAVEAKRGASLGLQAAAYPSPVAAWRRRRRLID